jgi:hypothetical protein
MSGMALKKGIICPTRKKKETLENVSINKKNKIKKLSFAKLTNFAPNGSTLDGTHKKKKITNVRNVLLKSKKKF